jgi:hypothetical protein
MWLHRRSEEPAPTEAICYWKKSKLSGIGSHLKCRYAADLNGDEDNKEREQSPGDIPGGEKKFLQAILTTERQNGFDSLILHHHSEPEKLQQLSLHILSDLFFSSGGNTYDEFASFCSKKMEESTCREAAWRTRGQTSTSLWQKLRFGRITASNVYEAAHCHTSDGALVEKLFGAKKVDSPAMRRGRLLEPEVLREVERMLHVKVDKIGIVLHLDMPFLGASPDGITDDAIIEIKCPTLDRTKRNYISLSGDLSHKCMAQLQMQMYMTGKRKGIFCVASPGFEEDGLVEIHELIFDEGLIRNIIAKALVFWKDFVFSKLRRKSY